MSQIVFILGAGASAQGGAPMMGNFLNESRDLVAAGKLSESDRSAFGDVFKTIGGLQQVFSKSRIDLENLESVFNALEMGKLILPVLFVFPRLSAITCSESLVSPTLPKSMLFGPQKTGSARDLAISGRQPSLSLVNRPLKVNNGVRQAVPSGTFFGIQPRLPGLLIRVVRSAP